MLTHAPRHLRPCLIFDVRQNMSRKLSPQERRFVEREFVAKEEARAKRRRLCSTVFFVGITAGSISALLRAFELRGIVLLFSHLTWIICLLIYVGVQILPISFSKDLDARWHLNPWKDSLSSLSEGRTLTEAIALLAGPHLLKIAASLVYLSFT